MLVLSRKTDQEILINGNIKISILKIKGNVVRIGIDAPSEVSIKRGELAARDSKATDATSQSIDVATELSPLIDWTSDSNGVAEEISGYSLLPLQQGNASASLDSGAKTQHSYRQTSIDVPKPFAKTLTRNRYCDLSSNSEEAA